MNAQKIVAYIELYTEAIDQDIKYFIESFTLKEAVKKDLARIKFKAAHSLLINIAKKGLEELDNDK